MNVSAPFIARPVATTLLTIGIALAGVLAFELPLQTRDQVAVAVKIGERLTGSGAVDDLAGVILQGVVERDDGVFLDGQGGDSR